MASPPSLIQTTDRSDEETQLPAEEHNIQEERNESEATENPEQETQETQKTDRHLKVLVLGDVGVGKSTIVYQYARGLRVNTYQATIGAECHIKRIETEHDKIRLDLYDIGGQQQTAVLCRSLFRNSTGAVIVYDLVQPPTFEGIAKWANEVSSKVRLPNGRPVPCIVMANKVDLAADPPNLEDAFCEENNILKIFRTSGLKNVNLDEAFNFLIEKMIECVDKDPVPDTRADTVTLDPETDSTEIRRSKCAC